MRTLHLRRLTTAALLLLPLCSRPAFAERHVPTIDDLLAISSVGSARISPDGARVAYTVTSTDLEQDAFVTQVWIVDVATGARVQITRGAKSAGAIQWSPDGRWLAFTSSRVGDKSQVFAIRPDGGEAAQLTKAEQGVGAFAWSPDGTQIAFTSSRDGNQEIYVMMADGTGLTRLTNTSANQEFAPSWAPDGSRLAVECSVPKNVEVCVVDAQGETNVSNHAWVDDEPVWSP